LKAFDVGCVAAFPGATIDAPLCPLEQFVMNVRLVFCFSAWKTRH